MMRGTGCSRPRRGSRSCILKGRCVAEDLYDEKCPQFSNVNAIINSERGWLGMRLNVSRFPLPLTIFHTSDVWVCSFKSQILRIERGITQSRVWSWKDSASPG